MRATIILALVIGGCSGSHGGAGGVDAGAHAADGGHSNTTSAGAGSSKKPTSDASTLAGRGPDAAVPDSSWIEPCASVDCGIVFVFSVDCNVGFADIDTATWTACCDDECHTHTLSGVPELAVAGSVEIQVPADSDAGFTSDVRFRLGASDHGSFYATVEAPDWWQCTHFRFGIVASSGARLVSYDDFPYTQPANFSNGECNCSTVSFPHADQVACVTPHAGSDAGR